MKQRSIFAILLLVLVTACGELTHPLASHKAEPLADDRRATAAVQMLAVPEFPGLAEAVVKNLAQYEVLASTQAASRRVVQVHGGIENGNLVWRLNLPGHGELGVLSQAISPGADIPTLAQQAAPIIVQLLTAGGAGPDTSNHLRVAIRPMHAPAGVDATPLQRAMADALISRGVPVGDENAGASVEGEMRILPGTGTKDVVQVDWTVRDPKGASLGTVSQGSPVERAILAGPLDALAKQIAGAAAPGVIDVIERKAPAILGGG